MNEALPKTRGYGKAATMFADVLMLAEDADHAAFCARTEGLSLHVVRRLHQ